MAILHTHATNQVYREIRNITKGHLDSQNRLIYKTEYEPTEVNRDKLITKTLPMVLSMARQSANSYNTKIELNDCISAGMIGLIEGVDLYILRAKTREHSAKLSSYVHPWIQKRIREYCHGNLTILTTSARHLKNTLEKTMMLSGNETHQDSEMGSAEFFDTHNDSNLMVEDGEILYELEQLSKRLFSTISKDEKQILFMNFGIGIDSPMSEQEIADEVQRPRQLIQNQIQDSLQKLRSSFDDEDKDLFVELIGNKSISKLEVWRI